MDGFTAFVADNNDDDDELWKLYGATNPRDTTIQIIISVVLGLTAFLAFCILRPRWTGMYAARKKTKDEATALPELPDSFFGWIVPLWKITDQQVLASAGLDAYVFLTFFKMALKFLMITLFFSLIVIKPVHDAFPEDPDDDGVPGNKTKHNNTKHVHEDMRRSINLLETSGGNHSNHTYVPFFPEDFETDYLWMYVAFAYLFSAILIYLIIATTRQVIEVRQNYLGKHHTVTDRTIRLSGIPPDLQDEEKIKDFIESLDIGRVESVTLCRKWKELDTAMAERMTVLRRLEEAYTIYIGYRRVERNLESLPIAQPPPPGPPAAAVADEDQHDESAGLIGANGPAHLVPYERERPKTTIRYGRFGLHSKKVDAIDYYEEKLRQADEKVKQLRQKEFAPMPLAFVTLDSVAACQMAIQAVLDPSPLQLIANQSPAPSDVLWPNTYLSRRSRMIRSWTITGLIVLLTILWSVILVPIAGLLTTETIGKVLPQVGKFLKDHENIRSLVNTQLPTLFATILNVLVPYLYYYLSWYQGMIAQGDIELSAISKNFFFTFFNFFVIFTVLGTASTFYRFFERFGDAIQDFRKIAYTLALSLQKFLTFYVNFIILQGVGLFPFRLLEVGAVSLYPIYRMGAKTPRGEIQVKLILRRLRRVVKANMMIPDYAELIQPPIFSYGFYLPSALLIFIICIVYSVLRSSWSVLLAGAAYFFLGHFVYKYQLLYAMDHQQQSTGRAWGMICDRIFIGLIFFQLTTAGQLILKQAVTRSVLMVPLVLATFWCSVLFGRTYKPLLIFIALRCVKKAEQEGYLDSPNMLSPPPESESGLGTADGSEEMERASRASSNDLTRNVWAADDRTPTPVRAANRAERLQRRIRNRRGQFVDENGRGESRERFVNPSLVAALDSVWIADMNVKSMARAGTADVEGEGSV
jgi:calcium permeable stress-gated cation channel